MPALNWITLDTPIGPLWLAGTERGVLRVAFAHEDTDALRGELERLTGVRSEHSSALLDDAVRQLTDYFEGTRRILDPPLDRRLSAGFRGEVQGGLADIPYGTTRTYKQIAHRLGRPGAVRAVGTACATNPIPLILPCHRVLRSDGGLGGYRGGLEAKRWLLHHEGTRSAPGPSK